jgi:hypothetical protein
MRPGTVVLSDVTKIKFREYENGGQSRFQKPTTWALCRPLADLSIHRRRNFRDVGGM